MKKTILVLFLALHLDMQAQYLLPQHVTDCSAASFCLDCGDPKASLSSEGFLAMESELNQRYSFKGRSGQLVFQVLVDSLGHGCVLSHSDPNSGTLTKEIMKMLNAASWSAARTKGRATMSSIMVLFSVQDDKLMGRIDRPDYAKAMISHGNPGTPEIFNKHYKYGNDHLGQYELETWLPSKSGMESDMGINSVVDKQGVVWHATYAGFARFEGGSFSPISAGTPFKRDESLRSLAVDKSGSVWASSDGKLYRGSGGKWELVTMPRRLNDVYGIDIGDDGAVLVCSDTGLIEWKSGKATVYDRARIPEMRDNSVFYGHRDRRGRLWIGTFKGTVMIEKDGQVHDMCTGDSPLRDATITDADEDEKGNLYFALYQVNSLEVKGRDKPAEGIAILSADGKWTHHTDTNSGMPANHVNDLMYDRVEKILWVATNDAGLVRFDLRDGWENYHNKNSAVPSSYVFQLSQAPNGDVYAATFNGLLRIRKKK